MAKAKSENEKKFEVLTYLELTCGALEECFNLINERRYNVAVKERIDRELKAFESYIFKKDSRELSNIGKYATAIIGKYLFEEREDDARVKRGLTYVLENIEYLRSTEDYSTLKRETLKNLSNFFRRLAERYAEQADRVSLK